MNMPARLTSQQVNRDVDREMTHIRNNHPVAEPARERRTGKCRICMDPEAKRRVNVMLAALLRPAEIVENISDINAGRRKNAQISYWTVRNHRENHFNLQEPAKEAVRRTMERRAAEEGVLIAEGVGNILTARGYLEVIANKGFEDLMRDDKRVDFETGVNAQLKLEQLEKADDETQERARMRRDVALIQQAVMETLTPEQMKAVSHRLSILRGDISEHDEDTIDAEVVDDDYDDDEADFEAEIDDDDELEG